MKYLLVIPAQTEKDQRKLLDNVISALNLHPSKTLHLTEGDLIFESPLALAKTWPIVQHVLGVHYGRLFQLRDARMSTPHGHEIAFVSKLFRKKK